DRMIAGGERRKTSSVAQTEDEDTVPVDEVVLGHGIESGLPTFHLAQEVGFFAIAQAFTHSGFVHADGGVAGFIDETAQQDAETVASSGGRIFHAVAAQPSHEENNGSFSSNVVWVGDEGAQLFAAMIGDPVIKEFRVDKVLTRGRRRGLCGNGQRKEQDKQRNWQLITHDGCLQRYSQLAGTRFGMES